MQPIANILTKNLFNDKTLYNVVDKKCDLIEGIPTLCVGVEMTKKNYPNFNILDMNIDDETKWTYGPREKRNIYESRLSKFIFDSMSKFVKGIKYEYVNIIAEGFSSKNFDRVKFLINNKEVKTTSFISNGVVYIYDKENNIVFGISIREFSYIGADSNSFLHCVYKNTRLVQGKETLPLDVRILFYDCKYAIPCLFY